MAKRRRQDSDSSQFLQKLLIIFLLFLIYLNGTISGYYMGIKTTEDEHLRLLETIAGLSKFDVKKKPVVSPQPNRLTPTQIAE